MHIVFLLSKTCVIKAKAYLFLPFLPWYVSGNFTNRVLGQLEICNLNQLANKFSKQANECSNGFNSRQSFYSKDFLPTWILGWMIFSVQLKENFKFKNQL